MKSHMMANPKHEGHRAYTGPSAAGTRGFSSFCTMAACGNMHVPTGAATHDELQLMPLVKDIKRERRRRRLGGCKGVFQHNTVSATDTGTLVATIVFEL
jgi:hypothetical protein